MKTTAENVVIVGLGYVGLPLALLTQQQGFNVRGIVRNPKKAASISRGKSPFQDEHISRKLSANPIQTSTDFESVSHADIIILCVPTPIYDDYTPDLTPLTDATTNVARFLKKGQLVILESTVNPGTIDSVVIPIIQNISSLRVGRNISVSHCPERINPGDKLWNVANIPRVIGSSDTKGLKRSLMFYRSILSSTITPMATIKEAEAVKIVENCFRDINIAFVNELAISFKRMGIDIINVLEGASTKPFAFMPHYPGCGVGGHCIPVDPYYLIHEAEKNGFSHKLLKTAREINNAMPEHTVQLLLELLQNQGILPQQCTVGILGIAYKGGIDDARESPSLRIQQILEKKNIQTIVYDPYIKSRSTTTSLLALLYEADVIMVATDHKEFKKLTPALLKKHGIKGIIDGRNFLNKHKFENAKFPYVGIGR